MREREKYVGKYTRTASLSLVFFIYLSLRSFHFRRNARDAISCVPVCEQQCADWLRIIIDRLLPSMIIRIREVSNRTSHDGLSFSLVQICTTGRTLALVRASCRRGRSSFDTYPRSRGDQGECESEYAAFCTCERLPKWSTTLILSWVTLITSQQTLFAIKACKLRRCNVTYIQNVCARVRLDHVHTQHCQDRVTVCRL